MQPVTTDSTRLYEFLAWLEVNKKRVLTAVGGALVLFVVVYVYLYYREQTELAASRALLALRPPSKEDGEASVSPTDLLKIAGEYGSTSAGERALLLAAGNLFAEGKYADAQTHFDRFVREHSGSPLTPIAAFGAAACLDALDQVDAALGAYQSVVNQFPQDAVAARARLAMAVLHEAKNQPDQAYRIYDELSKQMGGGGAVAEAATRLEKLQRRFPHLAPTNALAAATTTAVNPPPASTTNAIPPAGAPPPTAAQEAAPPQ